MILAVARKLGMIQDTFDVVMAGSVFKGDSPELIEAMTEKVREECPGARPVLPAFEPVVGALLMGMERFLEITPAIYENLSESLLRAEKQYGVRFKAV
jgi:hypothetical protein